MDKKKTSVYVLAAAAAVSIVSILYWSNSNLQTPSFGNTADANDETRAKLNLTSVKALTETRSLIGDVRPDSSFKTSEPVFIQANFSNPHKDSGEHIVIIEIRGADGTAVLSMAQGNVAPSGHLSLEGYWKPEQAGDYTLLVFVIVPEELNRGPIIAPVANIPIVVEG